MPILMPILLLSGIAIVCAVLLTVSDVFFGIKENETVLAVRDCLPGANCGACGYSGCDGYAKAVAEGKAPTNLCIPGGDKTAADIAAVLGVEAADVIERVAVVACNGTCDAAQLRYEYRGAKNCRAANLSYSGAKLCSNACLGYGDCVNACPHNAISIRNGVAVVDSDECVGCGICAHFCPNNLIRLITDTTRVVVKCSNTEKGAVTRKQCTNGCIGCMKCEKTCPHGAIKVENNLARINYELCTGCGECAKVCPVHCIHEGVFTSGSHGE